MLLAPRCLLPWPTALLLGAVLSLRLAETARAQVGAPEISAAPTVRAAYQPPDNPRAILRVTPDMRQYFDSKVALRSHNRAALREVVAAIVQPDGLHFAYDGEASFDAAETFRQRRGNCLSFALLVVAITREYHFEAAFESVEIPPRWDRLGDAITSVQHINVVVQTEDGAVIVDLRPDLVPRIELYPTEPVSDTRAFALLYSDVGFLDFVHGRPANALQWLIRATEVDRTSAVAWGNRARLHARLGDLASARTSFENALKYDPRGVSTLVGFVDVLQRLGRPEDLQLAGKLERRAQSLRERNPYYQQYLADTARARGDWGEAEKSLRRSIELKDDEPQFYAQLIEVLTRGNGSREVERLQAKRDQLLRRRPAATYLVP